MEFDHALSEATAELGRLDRRTRLLRADIRDIEMMDSRYAMECSIFEDAMHDANNSIDASNLRFAALDQKAQNVAAELEAVAIKIAASDKLAEDLEERARKAREAVCIATDTVFSRGLTGKVCA
jgi:chromosome segregation ATPase